MSGRAGIRTHENVIFWLRHADLNSKWQCKIVVLKGVHDLGVNDFQLSKHSSGNFQCVTPLMTHSR